MSCATYSCVAKAGDVGLTGARIKGNEPLRLLIAFAEGGSAHTRITPRLREHGYDLSGPAALGVLANALIRNEKPDVVVVTLDDPASDTLNWIVRIWQEFRTPTAVVSFTDDPTSIFSSIQAGAFAAVAEDASMDQIHAAFALAAMRGSALREAQLRIEQLERNLTNRRVVEQAKWRLVQEQGMTEPDAHLALQTVARNTRRPLLEVAQAVVDGATLESILER